MKLVILFGIIYLAIVSYLGYVGYRKTNNNNDYLVGSGQMPSFVMALSYGATFISTSAIIGFGGASAVNGMSLVWLTFLTIFVGVFISFVVFGKRTLILGKQLDAKTFPELLGKRYQSPLDRKSVV